VQGNLCHPSCPAGERFFAVLPAQSEALSADRPSAPGDPRVPELGEDLDIRIDLPHYAVWRNGDLAAEDVRDLWRDDLVSLVIGCSFSFEEALMVGIELRHIARGCNVPMYCTSIADPSASGAHNREFQNSFGPFTSMLPG
jgi:uncharacterized protein YcsI (UPF0317 family)